MGKPWFQNEKKVLLFVSLFVFLFASSLSATIYSGPWYYSTTTSESVNVPCYNYEPATPGKLTHYATGGGDATLHAHVTFSTSCPSNEEARARSTNSFNQVAYGQWVTNSGEVSYADQTTSGSDNYSSYQVQN